MKPLAPETELESLARQFKVWRRDHPQRHWPRHYWQTAVNLVPKLGLKIVAKAIGHDPSYLRRKVKSSIHHVP